MTLPFDTLTLTAAFLSGLVGSVHCVAMCGGIATGLSTASAPAPGARAALDAASALNVGRVVGYALAGAAIGAIGDGVQRAIDFAAWQTALRVALGIALMLIALRVAGVGDRWNALARIGAPLWRRLSPLQRRLMPARTLPRRLLLGLLWGWLPCGLSSSLLLVAWLEADAVHGALVMTAFGTGTLPAMLPLTWSGARIGTWSRDAGNRRVFAAVIFGAGLVSASAPWLMQVPELHSMLAVMGCRA